MDRADQDYLSEINEIVEESFSHPHPNPHYESAHHYKKFGVFKITYDPVTDIKRTRQFVFNVPLREADMIQRSQKSISEMINGEMVFLRSYEVRQESVQI